MKLKKDGTPSRAGRPKIKKKPVLFRPSAEVAEILNRQQNKTAYIESAIIEKNKNTSNFF